MKLNRFLAGLALALCVVCSTQAATLLPPGRQTFIDVNGHPLAGGTVAFFVPGTTSAKDTFQDAAGTVLNTNPVILDSAGSATIYGTGSYRQVLKDRNGNLIWDRVTSDTSAATSSWGGTSSGTPNAQTVAAPNFTSQDGQSISFVAGFSNTGPLTVNPSGSGPISVVSDTPTGTVTLSGGEIAAGNVVQLVYSTLTGTFHTAIAPSGTPIGTVLEYAGQTAPIGYLLANGQAVSRTSYSRLFAVVGTAFGAGDGTTTFNLPDKRGRVSVGPDSGANRVANIPALAAIGGVGGEPVHTLDISEIPTITPTGSVLVSYPAHTYATPTQSTNVASGAGTTVWAATTTASSTTPPAGQTFTVTMNGFGGGVAHNVVQPTIAMNFIIKF